MASGVRLDDARAGGAKALVGAAGLLRAGVGYHLQRVRLFSKRCDAMRGADQTQEMGSRRAQ